MAIRSANRQDSVKLAALISTANQAVAHQFNITFENNPKHPSFYTAAWVEQDFQRGESYFLYENTQSAWGCVAYEKPQANLAYLNRLAVLPQYQRQGIGTQLVEHLLQVAQQEQVTTISIGIIGEHLALHNWYKKLGFKDSERKNFAHLPFSVQLMAYQV